VTFLDSDDYVDVEIYRDMLWAAEQEKEIDKTFFDAAVNRIDMEIKNYE